MVNDLFDVVFLNCVRSLIVDVLPDWVFFFLCRGGCRRRCKVYVRLLSFAGIWLRFPACGPAKLAHVHAELSVDANVGAFTYTCPPAQTLIQTCVIADDVVGASLAAGAVGVRISAYAREFHEVAMRRSTVFQVVGCR